LDVSQEAKTLIVYVKKMANEMIFEIQKHTNAETQFEIRCSRKDDVTVGLYNPNSAKHIFSSVKKIKTIDYHEELKRNHLPKRKKKISFHENKLISEIQGAKDHILLEADVYVFSMFSAADLPMFVGAITEISRNSSKSLLQLIDRRIVSAVDLPLILDNAFRVGLQKECERFNQALLENRIIAYSVDEMIKMSLIDVEIT
jgi:hypothetical protein